MAPQLASAAPAWLSAADLSASGRDASNATVAMDDAGRTVAIWERQAGISHNVQVATRDPGEAFTGGSDLSPSSTDPALAMTPSGVAVVAWVHFVNPDSAVEVVTRQPGGSFSAPVQVAVVPPNSNPQDVHIAVNASGDVAVVWVQKDTTSADPTQFSVWAAVRLAGGNFSIPTVVSPLPLVTGNNSSDPRVAIDGAGDATVVWSYFDGANSVIQEATRPPAAGFSAPSLLSTTMDDGVSPAVAIDAAGDAVAAWVGFDVTDPGPPPVTSTGVVQASTQPAGGSFSTPVDLSDSSQTAASPQIAISPDGTAAMVWTRSDGSKVVVQAATGTAAGGFSPPVDLSAPGQDAFNPELAINGAGTSVALWKRLDGLNYIAQASVHPTGGSFSTPADLSAGGQDAILPQVAVAGSGDATAVWTRSNGSNTIAQFAGYDAEGPQLRNVSMPASAIVGKPISFSVNPFDIWPIASTTFDFGDGASASGASATHAYASKGAYQVTVNATDAAGMSTSVTRSISIFPANRFRIGRVSRSRRSGTGTLWVMVPESGRLVLVGERLRQAHRKAHGAGWLKLPIRPRGTALAQLRRWGVATVKLKVFYTPEGGATSVRHRQVRLREKAARRRRHD